MSEDIGLVYQKETIKMDPVVEPAVEPVVDPTPEPRPTEVSVDSLKSQVAELNAQLRSQELELARANDGIERVTANKDEILAEKREVEAKLRDMKELVGDRTPEQLKEALEVGRDVEGKVAEKVEILAKARMKDFRENNYEPLVKELNAQKEENKKLKDKLRTTLAGNEIRDAAIENGVKRPYLRFIERDFKDRIKVDNNGEKFYVDEAGHKLEGSINWEQQFTYLREEAPDMFEDNRGSKASHYRNEGGDTVANPWKKETWNMTKQGEIFSADPELAARMEAEAKN